MSKFSAKDYQRALEVVDQERLHPIYKAALHLAERVMTEGVIASAMKPITWEVSLEEEAAIRRVLIAEYDERVK